MKIKYLLVVVLPLLLSGCETEMQRLQECQEKGVSRDACYIAEKNRQAIESAESDRRFYESDVSDHDKEKRHKHKHTS